MILSLKTTINFLFFVLLSLSLKAQTPEIGWQNTIGGDGTEIFNLVQQTFDGGYILSGHSDSHISGDKTENNIGGYDCWIVKTDASGNIQWQNTVGGSK